MFHGCAQLLRSSDVRTKSGQLDPKFNGMHVNNFNGMHASVCLELRIIVKKTFKKKERKRKIDPRRGNACSTGSSWELGRQCGPQ